MGSMQFAHRHQPGLLESAQLDEYWAHGWFRMRQNVFTTHFLEFDSVFHSAIWLRVHLAAWEDDRSFVRLRKQNRRFGVVFRPCEPGPPALELEALFQSYRATLDFEVSPTLNALLLGRKRTSIYSSWQVELRDGNWLIASGIFDLGGQGAAGITTFSDPEYHKFGLGKYLIYLKMQWCRDRGLKWFYPGYYAPGNRHFDYKLHLGASALQYLEMGSGQWQALSREVPPVPPLELMKDKLKELQGALQTQGIVLEVQYYLHLDINLNPQVQDMGLFDFPVFLNSLPIAAVFDPRDGQFHLLLCRPVYAFPEAPHREGLYESDLLSLEQTLFSSARVEEVALALQTFYGAVQVF